MPEAMQHAKDCCMTEVMRLPSPRGAPRFVVWASCGGGELEKIEGLKPFSSLLELQRKIEGLCHVPVQSQRLICNSKQLPQEPNEKLKNVGVFNASEVKVSGLQPVHAGVWMGMIVRDSGIRMDCRIDFSRWQPAKATQMGRTQSMPASLEVECMVVNHPEPEYMGRRGSELFHARLDSATSRIHLESLDVKLADEGPELDSMEWLGPSETTALVLTPGVITYMDDKTKIPTCYLQVCASLSPGPIYVTVSYQAEAKKIRVTLASTLAKFLDEVYTATGVPTEDQKLLLDGKVLSKCRPLAPLEYFGIGDGSQLTLEYMTSNVSPCTGVWIGTLVYGGDGEVGSRQTLAQSKQQLKVSGLREDVRIDFASWTWLDNVEGLCQFQVETTLIECQDEAHHDCLWRRGQEVFQGKYAIHDDDYAEGNASLTAHATDSRIIDGRKPPRWMEWLGSKESIVLRFEDDEIEFINSGMVASATLYKIAIF